MLKLLLFVVIISISIVSGCAVEAAKDAVPAPEKADLGTSGAPVGPPAGKGPTITIAPDSPADIVRTFYERLRLNRFREAILLTNLRPAVEGLTDSELKEFQADFEVISRQVPENLQINGEIITGDLATVTAEMPGEETNKLELQKLKLRRENGAWIIMTVDDTAEKKVRQDGKKYFYQLRIETHEEEARRMLDRVSKAQMAYSLQNKGVYAEIPALIASGFLPEDIRTSESTGYIYSINLSGDKKRYSASATPGEYGKSGKLSFAVQLDGKGSPRLLSKDNSGKPLKL